MSQQFTATATVDFKILKLVCLCFRVNLVHQVLQVVEELEELLSVHLHEEFC